MDIYFVASARDYHAVDWYRAVKRLCPTRKVGIVTDLVEGEGFERMVDERDDVFVMFPTDKFLFSHQSRNGNLWRNIVKLAVLPINVLRLNQFSRKHGWPILHAHSMYYIVLCWLARVAYIATPQGSDTLVRPEESWLYKICAISALRRASVVTVDSIALLEKIRQMAGVESHVIQNGIDSEATRPGREGRAPRTRVASIRGLDPNYRIAELIRTRNRSRPDIALDLLYPFYEESYRRVAKAEMQPGDVDHGRLSKKRMFELLANCKLVVSVPVSDSSPRSVYEAIFSGCAVAATAAPWIDVLPECMRARVVIVDLDNPAWFEEALAFAEAAQSTAFVPDSTALDTYDEETAMKIMCDRFYGASSA